MQQRSLNRQGRFQGIAVHKGERGVFLQKASLLQMKGIHWRDAYATNTWKLIKDSMRVLRELTGVACIYSVDFQDSINIAAHYSWTWQGDNIYITELKRGNQRRNSKVREEQRANEVYNNSTNGNFVCWSKLLKCLKQNICIRFLYNKKSLAWIEGREHQPLEQVRKEGLGFFRANALNSGRLLVGLSGDYGSFRMHEPQRNIKRQLQVSELVWYRRGLRD